MSGRWVRRNPLPDHGCWPPDTTIDNRVRPAGDVGSLWRCDCGQLWVVRHHVGRGGVVGPVEWQRASWFDRVWHGAA